MSSNLPPGVTPGMIPGNRPEDAAWENFHEAIDRACENLSIEEARIAWLLGLKAMQSVQGYINYANSCENLLDALLSFQDQDTQRDMQTDADLRRDYEQLWDRARRMVDRGRSNANQR